MFLLNNRVRIVDEIEHSDNDVRYFLREEALKIWKNPHRNEFLAAHLPFFEAEMRLPLVLEKIQRIAGLI